MMCSAECFGKAIGTCATNDRISDRQFMRDLHIDYFDRMLHNSSPCLIEAIELIRQVFFQSEAAGVLVLVQWTLRHRNSGAKSKSEVSTALQTMSAPYRVVGGDTLYSVSSESELAAITTVLNRARRAEFPILGLHLTASTELLDRGECANSVRESVVAIRSVVRLIERPGSLSNALSALQATKEIDVALEEGFLSANYMSDGGSGLNPPDETDAQFMYAMASAFVNYLISKSHGGASEQGISSLLTSSQTSA